MTYRLYKGVRHASCSFNFSFEDLSQAFRIWLVPDARQSAGVLIESDPTSKKSIPNIHRDRPKPHSTQA